MNVKIEGDYLVGVDGGTQQILNQGKKPNLIIGDFDSYANKQNNIEQIRLKVDKDLTDSETAILELIKRGYSEIDIYGVEGGRLDHIYSNIMLLVFAGRQNVKVRAVLENGIATYYAEGKNEIDATKGNIVSIFPYAETQVIKSTNLKFQLNNLTLKVPSQVSGLSNIALEDSPTIDVSSGDGIIFVINQ